MKTRAHSAAWIGALSGGVVVLMFSIGLVLLEAHRLRSELTRLKQDAADSRRARDAAEAELALHRDQVADLRRTVGRMEDDTEATPAAGPTRARIVRENQIVGAGWVLPGTNAVTGQPEVNVVLEAPVGPPATPVETLAATPAPATREYRYAYWYQQPLYTWGAVVSGYPPPPHCTNDAPGFAPPPPATSQPPAALAPSPAASVATPVKGPRVTRTLPFRPSPAPPVKPLPPPYHISASPTIERAPALAAPLPSATPKAATVPTGPVANRVPTPAPRILPLPNRPL
ncbi:MAG: hypothetical protein IPM17_03855 [Verrucomicrobia bacterium]|nr:hypothetical protein [Verrucomicrobiota bacterium]